MQEGEGPIDLDREAELWRESLRWPQPAKPAGPAGRADRPADQESDATPQGGEGAGRPDSQADQGRPAWSGPEVLPAEPSDPGSPSGVKPPRIEAQRPIMWRLALATPIAIVLFTATYLAMALPAFTTAFRSGAPNAFGAQAQAAAFFLDWAVVTVPILVFTLGFVIERWVGTKPLVDVVALSGACGLVIACVLAAMLERVSYDDVWMFPAYLAVVGPGPVVAGIGTPLLLRAALRWRLVRVVIVALALALFVAVALARLMFITGRPVV